MFRRTIIAVGMIMMMFLVSGCSNNEAYTINETGYGQYQAGEYEEAIDTYTAGIERFPDYIDFYTNRGMAYFEMGDTDNALHDLDHAVTMEEHAPEAYANRGMVYLGIGDYQSALVDFYKAIEEKEYFEIVDGLYYTYLNLGTLLNQVGEQEQALAVYELAMAENDEDPSLYNAMGMLYIVTEEYEKAIEFFNIALDMDQNFAYAYGNRGHAYYKMGDYSIALSDANTALSIDPYIPQVYDMKAKAQIALEDVGSAKKTIRLGLDIWESFADLYITLGNVLMSEENYGEALVNYGLGVRYGNDEGHKGQGVAYRLIGQYDDAIESLTTYLDDNPHDMTAQMEIGLSQQALLMHDDAIVTYEAILTVVPDSTDVKYYLALSYEYIKDYEKAVELLKDVIENDQSNLQAVEELEYIEKHLLP